MIAIRHERFLQARPQGCFQLFLDEGVICYTRGKKWRQTEFLSVRSCVSEINCSKPPLVQRADIGTEYRSLNNNIKSYLVSKFFLRYSTVTGQENAQGQNEDQANHFRFRSLELKAKKKKTNWSGYYLSFV